MSEPALREAQSVICRRGVVATGPADAAAAGARLLAQGGNAMDAAAATALACAVLEPEAVDLGGYVACGILREAATGAIWALDANTVAPARAMDGMFQVLPQRPDTWGVNQSEYGCSVAGDANVYGPLSVGVPGFIAGVGLLAERWGRLRWPQIVAPSQALVEACTAYGNTAAAIARRLEIIRRFPSTYSYLLPDGHLPAHEERWRRPGMAKTLARLASAGWRDFYDGELGRRIAAYVQQLGGILTPDDMAAYRPRIQPALSVFYRHAQVAGPPPPNGALTSLQILALLDTFPPDLEIDSAAFWHRLAEVMKLAWRDRLNCLADPDQVALAPERLLDADYSARLTAPLRRDPELIQSLAPLPMPHWPHGTVHVSAGDADGNLVALTISQGNPFGSCLTIPETGIILGHGMCRFDPHPGLPNSVAARKRPLNNVAPLLLRLPDSYIALGTRGGRPIVNVCAQLAQRCIDGQSPASALRAPRMHVLDREPLEFIEFDFTENVGSAVAERLVTQGHVIRRTCEQVVGAGAAHLIEWRPGQSNVFGAGNTWASGVD